MWLGTSGRAMQQVSARPDFLNRSNGSAASLIVIATDGRFRHWFFKRGFAEFSAKFPHSFAVIGISQQLPFFSNFRGGLP